VDHLWTPWRYAYVTQPKDQNPDARETRVGVPTQLAAWPGDHHCVFCNLIAAADYAIEHGMAVEEADRAANIVLRGTTCYICLNAYPYTSGHVMVVPYAHVDRLVGLGTEAAHEMMELALKTERVLEQLYAQATQGHDLAQGDVEGAIRAVIAQGSLFEFDAKAPKTSFETINLRKRPVRARTAAQDSYIRALKRHEMVFGIGPAGTGKTWLAVAQAAQLFERKEVDRIILTRPAVEAGERLGFLPGDLREKVDPYLRPIYDALYDLMDSRIVERALQTGEIEIAPLAFMRGRTLTNAAIILDEAQNTTAMQMKMFLTRLGENSRMIVTGDPSQVDLPNGQTSGLAEATKLLDGVDGIAQVKFTAEDVIRHELVARIVAAYEGLPQKPATKKS